MDVPLLPQPPPLSRQQMIVTSGEDDDDDIDDADSDHAATDLQQLHDDLFDDQADDEDEAYVYKHLRSGVSESITVVQHLQQPPPTTTTGTPKDTVHGSTQQKQQIHALKPRTSDAVLSCPYCFHIVCMDCQQHEYYNNQYRAMFVMGVTVRWDKQLTYDTSDRCLVPFVSHEDTVPSSNGGNKIHDAGCDDNTIYYTVCCASCQTTVAALDMTDEVYHFSGCLASS
jgi:E2F-associated phosphoprotein